MSRWNRPRLSHPNAAPADSSEPSGYAVAAPAANPVTRHADALDAAIRFYRARDLRGWDALALSPLQHGIETITREPRVSK
jgi:hypothetical protein